MSEVYLENRRDVDCISPLALSNPISHFIGNSLGSRLNFFPFYVFVEDTCRSLNPADAARSIRSSLKGTGYNDPDMNIHTTNFLFLGYFNIPLKSVIDYSCYWYVRSCELHPSCIGVISSVSCGLSSSYLVGINHGR